MLTHQLARRRGAVAIAGLLAVAVLGGGAGIAAAGSGSAPRAQIRTQQRPSPSPPARAGPMLPTPVSRPVCWRKRARRSTGSSRTGRSTRIRPTPSSRASHRARSTRRKSSPRGCSTRPRWSGSTRCSGASSCPTQDREPKPAGRRTPSGRRPRGACATSLPQELHYSATQVRLIRRGGEAEALRGRRWRAVRDATANADVDGERGGAGIEPTKRRVTTPCRF